MTDNDSLFAIERHGSQLTIERNLVGELVIFVGGAGVRSGIALPASDLYELSDWLERYLDGRGIDPVAEYRCTAGALLLPTQISEDRDGAHCVRPAGPANEVQP